MKELPENQTLSKQINETLKDRVITEVFNATKFHKNTFYFGDPLTYSELLIGRRINSSMSFGMYVDIILDKETKISFGDGTNLKYGTISNKMPNNYQLLLALDNNTYLTFTVGMFGFPPRMPKLPSAVLYSPVPLAVKLGKKLAL